MTISNKKTHNTDKIGQSNREPVHIHRIVETLWNYRKRIATITFIFILISLGYAILLPNQYTAVTTMLPESEDRGLGQFAQLSGLMSLSGFPVAPVSETYLYPELMKSEAILRDVVYKLYNTEKFNEPVDLIRYWDIGGNSEHEKFQKAIQILREVVLSISIARDSRIINLEAETNDPNLSADIVNTIADNLGQYVLNQRRTRASQQRQWIEKRLGQVESELRDSEDSLKDFRESNRRISDSPELMLQQERYIRDVEKFSAIYLELSKQYEMVRVQEVRDMPVVQVLDPASPPAKKSGPERRRILMLGTLFGLFTGVLSVYVNRLLKISDDENKTLAHKISSDVKNDITNVLGVFKQ